MALIKMNKHQVYNYISDHPEWFKNTHCIDLFGEEKYLTCHGIEDKINEILRKDCEDIFKADYIVLRGATLTAMVHDDVIEREYSEMNRCYTYCPILPIREEYRQE